MFLNRKKLLLPRYTSNNIDHIYKACTRQIVASKRTSLHLLYFQDGSRDYTEVLDLHEKTKAQLENVVNTYSKKHGVPDESHYDGAKDTLFGWTGQMMAQGSGFCLPIKPTLKVLRT